MGSFGQFGAVKGGLNLVLGTVLPKTGFGQPKTKPCAQMYERITHTQLRTHVGPIWIALITGSSDISFKIKSPRCLHVFMYLIKHLDDK